MRYPDPPGNSRGEYHERRHQHAPREERRRSPDTSRRYEDSARYMDRDRGGDRPDRERDRKGRDRAEQRRGRDDQSRHSDRDPATGAIPRRNGRHESASERMPSRPSKRDIEKDPSIQASSLMEYRQLKRQKMAEQCEWLIWERSPPPMDEPLLQEQDEAAEQAPVGAKDVPLPVKNEQEEALDQEELKLFCDWLQERKSRQKEEAEKRRIEEEENRPVGPMRPDTGIEAGAEGEYGGNLRPGEGERMAAFAKQGQRIPRRGEVGLDSAGIKSFEEIGYVMSGSRHSKMNAVRIRKENQIYTAEEKAALAMFNAEEAQRKEEKLVEEMKKLVEETVGKSADAGQDGGQDA